MIADHLTPKFDMGGVAYTLSSRDHKGVMAVVLSKSDRCDPGEWVQQTRNARSNERYVYRGEYR